MELNILDENFNEKKIICTEVLILNQSEQKILLGRKKRGFKTGKFFGYGGKIESKDSSIESAACRELKEESCLQLQPQDLQKVGKLQVQFTQSLYYEVHAFIAFHSNESDIQETEEMQPFWFKFDEIPWESCLPDTKIWYKLAIEGKKFDIQFLLDNNDEILKQNIKILN